MLVAEGNVSPEGLKGFRLGNAYYLGLSNEVSNTTTLFHLATAAAPVRSSPGCKAASASHGSTRRANARCSTTRAT